MLETEIEVSWDCDITFDPNVVQKHEGDISAIDQKIISLYAKRITIC